MSSQLFLSFRELRINFAHEIEGREALPETSGSGENMAGLTMKSMRFGGISWDFMGI